MDWWIVKQLRAMVLTDLGGFVPKGYFENETNEIKKLKLHNGIEGSDYFSRELKWGYLAGKLGQQLFFKSTANMSARQVSASEVLMNLGILAAAEAAATQLSKVANAKGVSDSNAGAVAEQLGEQQIPTLLNNVSGALKQYLRYLTPLEAEPFLPLLESESDLQNDCVQVPVGDVLNHLNSQQPQKDYWYKRPIGVIGIGLFITIIGALFVAWLKPWLQLE